MAEKQETPGAATSGQAAKDTATIAKQESQSEPLHVVVASDNTYGVPMLVMALSLAENASDGTRYQLHVLAAPDLDPAYVRAVDAILEDHGMPRAHVVSMGAAYGEAAIRIPHTTVQTFYRLRIPSLLDCDRCLYLDVDTVVLSDLRDLISMDMNGAYVAGVKAAGYYWPPEARRSHAERLGMEELDQYVNAGVLVMDVAAMRRDLLEEEFAQLVGREYDSQDQDVINVACHGRIRLLPPRYNSMTKYSNADPSLYGASGFECIAECYERDEWERACTDPAIVHYADRVKPWDSMAVEHAQDWWRYALSLGEWADLGDGLLDHVVGREVAARDTQREQARVSALERDTLRGFKKDALSAFGRFSAEITGRLDIKLEGEGSKTLELVSVSDVWAKKTSPAWLQEGGTGYVIESWAGEAEIFVRALTDGVLRIWLRGRDVRDDENRHIAKWIRYHSLLVDGEELLEEPRAVWHNKPAMFELPVAKGDEICALVVWGVQSFEEELREERCQVSVLRTDLEATRRELEATRRAANLMEAELERTLDECRRDNDLLAKRLDDSRRRAAALEQRLSELKASKAYRIGCALAKPLRLVRRKIIRGRS